jgi:hypothetical protein
MLFSLATGAGQEEHRQWLASIEEEATTLIGGGPHRCGELPYLPPQE